VSTFDAPVTGLIGASPGFLDAVTSLTRVGVMSGYIDREEASA
jgi:hypothetical protein